MPSATAPAAVLMPPVVARIAAPAASRMLRSSFSVSEALLASSLTVVGSSPPWPALPPLSVVSRASSVMLPPVLTALPPASVRKADGRCRLNLSRLGRSCRSRRRRFKCRIRLRFFICLRLLSYDIESPVHLDLSDLICPMTLRPSLTATQDPSLIHPRGFSDTNAMLEAHRRARSSRRGRRC